jgi:hypothetical protein
MVRSEIRAILLPGSPVLHRFLEKKHFLVSLLHLCTRDVLIMEFPGRTAIARSPWKAGIEVMAQARANWRLIDHFKVTVNRSEVLNVNFPLSALFSVADLPRFRLAARGATSNTVLMRSR